MRLGAPTGVGGNILHSTTHIATAPHGGGLLGVLLAFRALAGVERLVEVELSLSAEGAAGVGTYTTRHGCDPGSVSGTDL